MVVSAKKKKKNRSRVGASVALMQCKEQFWCQRLPGFVLALPACSTQTNGAMSSHILCYISMTISWCMHTEIPLKN